MAGLSEDEELRQATGLNCTPPAIDDFPRDLFTERQRQDGAVVIHAIIALYLFAALAVVCDKYFVPAVERICHALNMSNDVAGATFMAAATSAPELFVNVIGTFITEGDIGVGTIVGSAVFNILAVAACCGIGAGMVVPLDWWPLTRDCLAYGVTVAFLICIIHDERVEWYEALTLVLLYIVYIAVMYWDKSIQSCARGGIGSEASRRQSEASPAEAGEVLLSVSPDGQTKMAESLAESLAERLDLREAAEDRDKRLHILEPLKEEEKQGQQLLAAEQINGSIKAAEEARPRGEEQSECARMCSSPTGGGGWWRQLVRQVVWVTTWPIHLVFLFTIPDCEKPRFKRLFPLTFFMCIVWIGSLSYVVAWLITIIGDTLKIPDSVMGITFLAAGTSVPEAVSSVIVAKQGHGSMGISNSIGSNTFDILLCLGLPWFIKASFLPTSRGQHYVNINSRGLEYSAISLLSTLLMLYLTFSANKFKLDRKVGQACLLMYAVFLILASLIELNVFFTVNLPTCGRP